MLRFPIQSKPVIDTTQFPIAFEYPNIVSKEIADDIISIATSSDGWHRRGSKTPNTVQASFTTCLLHDLSHPVYNTLDVLWKQVVDEHNFNISFVEYYEVKEYLPGDAFGLHLDTHCSVDYDIDRKLNLIIQLSDPTDYEGGDLIIGKHIATKELGSAIFFPAGYLHHVSTVTSGKRYVLIGHAWGSVGRR